MGGEIGTAFVATLVRVRSQIASNLIGLHVQIGDAAVLQRLQAYAAVAGARPGSGPAAAGRGVARQTCAQRRGHPGGHRRLRGASAA